MAGHKQGLFLGSHPDEMSLWIISSLLLEAVQRSPQVFPVCFGPTSQARGREAVKIPGHGRCRQEELLFMGNHAGSSAEAGCTGDARTRD